MSEKTVFSRGSFFHGTRADLKIGDLIVTGKKKNYNDDRKSEYVYFAGTLDAAIWRRRRSPARPSPWPPRRRRRRPTAGARPRRRSEQISPCTLQSTCLLTNLPCFSGGLLAPETTLELKVSIRTQSTTAKAIWQLQIPDILLQ